METWNLIEGQFIIIKKLQYLKKVINNFLNTERRTEKKFFLIICCFEVL